MKSRTKLLIEWLKKLICAADETYSDVADEALIFLDSLPALENDLRNGGYIQDRNGRPVKNGDKIKIGHEEGTLYWSRADRRFYFNEKDTLYLITGEFEKI